MRRASKTCSTPGCPQIVRSGRCPSCTQEAEQRRGSASQRGYDAAWARTRRAYLEEYPFCEQAGCWQQATDVDHIDGLGPRGPRGFDWGNLRSLCHPHHSARTARDQPGGFRQ